MALDPEKTAAENVQEVILQPNQLQPSTFSFHCLTKTKQLQQWIVNNYNASLLPKVLVNICRRSGVGGKDITEEKKVSYLSALVTLLQVPTDPQKVSTSGLTVTLDLIGDPGSGSAAGLGSPS